MARKVSPNRMELMKLSNELKTARRGHRLLKDKRDGLMQRFLEILDETIAKREEVDALLSEAASAMSLASAVMEPEVLLQAMQMSSDALDVEVSMKNVMAVDTPEFVMPTLDLETEDKGFTPAYGMVHTSGDIDIAFDSLNDSLKPMLELATLEKTIQVLASELESTRRRVNSLEHVLIPELEESIRLIRMKMEENERDNLTRLMKVKDMIIAEEIQARRRAEAIQ